MSSTAPLEAGVPIDATQRPPDVGAVLEAHFDAVRDELGRVRALVKDAVAKLEAGFSGLSRQVEEQDRLLGSILERLASTRCGTGEQVGMRQFAHETGEVLTRFSEHLVRTGADSTEVARQIEGMSERMDEVSRMVAGIKRIAQQTKMISLNAAIEAAHAGDVGAGFGVVASEVKRLAGESAELAEAIDSSTGAAGDHLTSSRALVHRMATTDTEFAVDASSRVKEMLREAESVDGFITEQVQEAAQLARNLNSSVALSVIGLQFDDIVSQLIGHLEARFEAIAPLVSASIAAAEEEGGERLAGLLTAFQAQTERLAAADRPAVEQASMGAGDVCLF